jgi:tRNA U54 and U55 pseudouridine synthase Pus10
MFSKIFANKSVHNHLIPTIFQLQAYIFFTKTENSYILSLKQEITFYSNARRIKFEVSINSLKTRYKFRTYERKVPIDSWYKPENESSPYFCNDKIGKNFC